MDNMLRNNLENILGNMLDNILGNILSNISVNISAKSPPPPNVQATLSGSLECPGYPFQAAQNARASYSG